MREPPPGPATAQHIKNSVEDLPHIHTSGPPSRQSFRDQRFKNGPFGVREITGIAFHRGNSSSLSTSFVFNRFYCVNSDEKLPKSAEIKIRRVGNSRLAHASASQKFPDQVFLETLPFFLRDLQVIIPAGNWAWLLPLCFSGGGAGFQRLRGQVMEHPGLALLMQTITLPSNINPRRVMQQAVH